MPLVSLVTVGDASDSRERTVARLERVGLRVLPAHRARAEAVDLVVVHRGTGSSVVAAVATSVLRSAAPHLVLADAEPDSAELVGAIAGGAQGWLNEQVSDVAFAGAVRDVLAGSVALSRAHVGVVVRELQRRSERTLRRADGRTVQLSGREWEVLERLAAGSSGADVAARLGVGQTAVRGYVASAVRRLGVRDRSEAVQVFVAATGRTGASDATGR